MARFYLLRHGESEWNANGDRYCGISDIPLSSVGKVQAMKAAQYLKTVHLDTIYASPLKRAVDTARPTAEIHALAIRTDDRLKEMSFGKWEGKTQAEVKREFPQNWKDWHDDPTHTHCGETGESAQEIFKRTDAFFREKTAEHPDEDVLVVAHNVIFRVYMAGSLSAPLEKFRNLSHYNAGISVLELEPGHSRWIQMNSVVHL